MATSPVAICNSALALLGSDRITSLSDENARAKACNENYNKVRKWLLNAHPWGFAKEMVELALLSETPAFKWDSFFQLPSDVIRVLELEDTDACWERMGSKIACNLSECSIVYIKDVTDTTLFTPVFDEALAAELAYQISYYISPSGVTRDELRKEADRKVALARSFSAQEASVKPVRAPIFWNARYRSW